jgi:putative spermidine/putrescine transport system substrate-binding protein
MTKLVDRRTVLAGGMAAAGALAMSPRRAFAADVVYVNTWGGKYQEVETATVYEPFTKATGIEVRAVVPTSMAKLKAVVETGNYEFDCLNIGEVEFYQAKELGLYEPIDTSIITPESVDGAEHISEPGVESVTIATGLVYNKDKFPNGGPQSWADFWNVEKFPGTRAMIDRPHTVVAFALLADGVPMDQLYPIDLDRAFKKLDEIKPHIKVWWKLGNQSVQLFADGEADMMAMWNGRGEALRREGKPIEVVWNQAEHYANYWGVPKGDPRAKQAWEFIKFASQAKPQADFCKELLYGPSNLKAFEHLPEDIAAVLPSNPEIRKLGFRPKTDLLVPQLAEIQERWTEWMAS